MNKKSLAVIVSSSNMWEIRKYAVDKVNIKKLLALDSYILKTRMAIDVGCGTGVPTLKLSEKVDFAVGLDISTEKLRIAKSLSHKAKVYNVEFIAASTYAMPFRSDSFDLALSSQLLEHLENPELAIRQIARVVKSGGDTVLDLPTPLFELNRAFRVLVHDYIKGCYRPLFLKAHMNKWTPWQWIKFVKKSGLIATETIGYHISPLRRLCIDLLDLKLGRVSPFKYFGMGFLIRCKNRRRKNA